MADSLVRSMSGDFDPSVYTDDFADALKTMIDAKLEGGHVATAATKEAEEDNVVDLMSALQASVDRAKKGSDDTGEEPASEEPAQDEPAKKSAQKAPAKKTAAKKSTSKSGKKTAKKSTKKTA